MQTALNIETAMTLYHLFVAASFLTGILSLLLSLTVYLRSPKSQVHRKWSLTTFFVGVWSFAFVTVIITDSYSVAYGSLLIAQIVASFIPVLYYNFVVSLLRRSQPRNTTFLLYGGSIFIASTNIFFRAIVDLQPYRAFHFWIVPGFTYYLMPLFYSIVLAMIFYQLHSAYVGAVGFQKKQIIVVLVATLIGFGSGMTNFFPQLFGVYPFGNFFTWTYVVVVSILLFRGKS